MLGELVRGIVSSGLLVPIVVSSLSSRVGRFCSFSPYCRLRARWGYVVPRSSRLPHAE